MASSELNLVARIGRNPVLASLVVLLFFSVFGFAGNSYVVAQNNQQDEIFLKFASRLSVLSQQIAKNVGRAIQGSENTYLALQDEVDEFETSLSYLKAGNPAISLLPSSPETIGDLNNMSVSWEQIKSGVNTVLANQ